MDVNAVIVAAGEGNRMGGDTPKPFLPLAGRPLLLHTLERFARSAVRRVIVVVAARELSRCRELVRSEPGLRLPECVFQTGGPRRQDSVARGLALLDGDCRIVVVHDGVRPLVSSRLIDRCVEVARSEGAVVVGVPVRNTIKVVSPEHRVRETPPRECLWEIHTPQVFHADVIREAYDRAAREGAEVTDDAMLVERMGRAVVLVEGERTNIKITVPEDLIFAEALLREGKA